MFKSLWESHDPHKVYKVIFKITYWDHYLWSKLINLKNNPMINNNKIFNKIMIYLYLLYYNAFKDYNNRLLQCRDKTHKLNNRK